MSVKKIPMRQCVGCREMKEKRELIRILCTEEKEVILDVSGRKNGRGAYICPNTECLEKAIKNKGLERAVKMAVPASIYEELKKEMEEVEAG